MNRKLLEEILKEKSGDNLELPTFVVEEPSWIEAFKKWIFSLFDFKVPKANQLTWANFVSLLKIIAIFVLVSILIYLVIVLVRKILASKRGKKPTEGEHLSEKGISIAQLESDYQSALNQNLFNLALRLYWPIFLKKHKLKGSLTPKEYREIAQAEDFSFYKVYEGMFSSKRLDKEELSILVNSINLLKRARD